jgi:transcriptional regulator with XRE-family HTH domain
MVNVNKLKGRFVENGKSVADIAEYIGVDKATLYRKLNNPELITLREADAIVKCLNLSADDAVAIFFSEYVA